MNFFKLLPLIFAIQSISYADYTVIYPLDSYLLSIKNKVVTNPDDGSEQSVYTEWSSNTDPYDCAKISPLSETIDEGVSFTKTFSNCLQDQTRTKTLNSKISIEHRTVQGVGYTTQSIGTKKAVATYTEWVRSGVPYKCEFIGPMEDTVVEGSAYTKTYKNCSADFIRTKTLSGVETTESKVVTGYEYSVQSIGTLSGTECLVYNDTTSQSRWIDAAKTEMSAPNYKYELTWKGKYIANFTSSTVNVVDNSFTKDGYIYSRGKFFSRYDRNFGYYYFAYQVCRKPV